MSENNINSKNIDIGSKIKALRKIRQISLSTMAEELGMSYSYLWGLENNKHSISVVNLQKLSEYFDIDLIYFFTPEEETSKLNFIPKDEVESIKTDDDIIFELITPSISQNLQVTKVYLPPNAPAENSIHKHNEGEELITVLEGKLYVMIEDESYELNEGDSIFFESNREHIMFTKNKEAVFFLISSPPYGHIID